MELGDPMKKPVWKLNEINLNTIIIVVGLFADAFWIGSKYSEVMDKMSKNADAIVQIKTDVSSLETSRTADEQDISGLKYRVSTLENAATSTASTLHDQEKAIGQIASDVRATRIIVECLAKHDCTASASPP